MTESVWTKARDAIRICADDGTHSTWIHDIERALDAGEAAERRAENAENDTYGAAKAMLEMEANALALLKPARPEDGLLPAIRDVMQRLELCEDDEPAGDGV